MSFEPVRSIPLVLAEVAHELRAPLGGIEAMVQLLGETATSPDQERLIAGLKAAASHLRAVASGVIDQARGGASAPVTAANDFSLRDLLDGVSAAAEARARAKSLTFVMTVDDALPEIMHGEALRIRQMLENLLDNAFKVTTAGEVSLTIRQVDRRKAFVGLIFEVRDTGPGLSQAAQQKLFRTFSRVDNGVPGSGLGLSLVARMARAMGGDAGCSSETGAGALFWFSLRLPEKASLTTPHVTRDAPVLVVDDNHANRMIMRAILEHYGHTVIDVATGEDALAFVLSNPVKAVMLDQTLPGLSGIETLQAIRKLSGPIALTPVVPVTGRVAPEDKAAFAAAGANGFVEKPVNARAIRDALEAALVGAAVKAA